MFEIQSGPRYSNACLEFCCLLLDIIVVPPTTLFPLLRIRTLHLFLISFSTFPHLTLSPSLGNSQRASCHDCPRHYVRSGTQSAGDRGGFEGGYVEKKLTLEFFSTNQGSQLCRVRVLHAGCVYYTMMWIELVRVGSKMIMLRVRVNVRLNHGIGSRFVQVPPLLEGKSNREGT